MKSSKLIIGIVALLAIITFFIFKPFDLVEIPLIIENFVTQFGIFAPIVYGLLYFIVILLFLPATAFTVLAGVLFGKVTGTVIVVISATLSAMTAFVISRYFAGNFTETLTKKYPSITKFVDKIETESEKNGFRFFFLMRCLFVPYIIFSYASGLVKKAKLSDFTYATFITNIIFSFAFVFLGESLLQGPRALILPAVLIVLVLLIPRIIKKFKKNV